MLIVKVKILFKQFMEEFRLKYATKLLEYTLNKQGKEVCFSGDYNIYNTQFEGKNTLFGRGKIAHSSIGLMTYCQRNCLIGHAQIGRFCSIGPGVCIALGEHPTNYISTHQYFYSDYIGISNIAKEFRNFVEHKEVIIGNDVWIGANCYIRDGVKIGNGAIIATGSVVVKDVDPYCIIGGVPAKPIKYRFDDETIKELEKIEWWNLTLNQLKVVNHFFISPLDKENAKIFIDTIKKIRTK